MSLWGVFPLEIIHFNSDNPLEVTMSFVTDDIKEFVNKLSLGECIDMMKRLIIRAENAKEVDLERLADTLNGYDDEEIRELLAESIEMSILATLFRSFQEFLWDEEPELAKNYDAAVLEFANRLPEAWPLGMNQYLDVEKW